MRLTLTFLLLLTMQLAFGQQLYMTDETTTVSFEASRLLGKLYGTAKGVNGTAVLDSNNLQAASMRFSLSPATFIHDENYVGPDFTKASCFDPVNHPEITLTSASITWAAGPNSYQFKGALIVKGLSRDISFPFTAIPNVGGYDFRFTFVLRKKLYGLKCGTGSQMRFHVRAYARRNMK